MPYIPPLRHPTPKQNLRQTTYKTRLLELCFILDLKLDPCNDVLEKAKQSPQRSWVAVTEKESKQR
jgi:hypothetical protein